MADKFTITEEEQALIESLRKNGVVIDHRTGTAYVGQDERLFTASEVRSMVNELKEEAEDDHVRAWIDGVVARHGLDPA